MSFVHLHVHTEYSLLDGFSNIKKLVARAKELEMPALAITDHGTMFGVIEFYKTAKEAGIKPIIGMEAYLAPRAMGGRDPKLDKKAYHLLLLAENETGYRNLLRLASTAQLDGFYYNPRIDHETLARHSEGLIVTSGCMSAEIPRALLEDNPQEAVRRMNWYYDVFGSDRFFVELQQHNIPEMVDLNRRLMEMGAKYSMRYVATNDVHYINPSDARLQDVLLAIQTGALLSDPNRMRMTDPSYYLRTPQEMAALFSEVPEALSNTLMIAERATVDLGFKGYHLPEFAVPEGHIPSTYLRSLCEEGLQRRYGPRAEAPVVRQRLDYELGVIEKMGFASYFLIVWDLCRQARETGIWYNARGSAAGSIVAYVLDITLVDPIEHGLLFERFLNPGRISMPDIDLDFRDDRRSEMLEYAARKYGDDKVAQIITFGTLGARAAIRDVGRVMDVPLSEVDRIAKLVPFMGQNKEVTLGTLLEENAELRAAKSSSETIAHLLETAVEMEGVVRNAGTHAAGVVISDRPLTEYLPLHRPTSGAEETPIKTVTQFEMGILDSLGMLKVDFLGLATLTIMARACDLIEQRHGKKFNLGNIPTDDAETFRFLGEGRTAGVFQLEGSGMTRWLVQMRPTNLEHVIAMVALFRPGPMEFIPKYIESMHGLRKPEYRHPALEPIFASTYGIPVYQEQLMRAAVDLAGYSPSEADELRSAISKKKAKEIEKHRGKFIAGAQGKGMDEATATAIYADWEEFARYGFNKCLPGDVEVLDAASGRLVRIEDLYNGTVHIEQAVTCDTTQLRLLSGRVSRVMANGVKPVYRLTTGLGHSIEATGNHPFLTYNGWRMLGELRPGDRIAAPRALPVEGRNEWPDHEVITLGHLLAEGNLCHPHSVYYYSQEGEQVADFVQAAELFENVRCSISVHKSTYSVYAARAERSREPGVFRWARDLGLLGCKAPIKEIPAAVFELTNRQIGLLLSRMWEGDGHIDPPGRSMFYATASERMARQVQHLLLRLGVIAKLRKVIFPYKEGRTGYQVFVTGHKNLARFAEMVGRTFVSRGRKQDLQAILACEPGNACGTQDVVPLEVKELVRAAKSRSGQSWEEINRATGIAQREFYPSNAPDKRGFTRATLARLADYFDDIDLRRQAESDIYWDEIVSIEYVGDKPTYDLEVPDTHNFVANDLIVHNSHAADYGVIAVQTAFLKLHYPAEYMTALLSVSKSQTEKVAYYVADARALGLAVLPPDVQSSQWDFSIENSPQGAAIRFGLGAIKNVGYGAVDLITQARASGSFGGLNDFVRRVDLRQLGKRALECLIKVGALDGFGPRSALLAAMDRILGASTSHFRAVDSGQLSLFGGDSGVSEEIVLPPGDSLDRRQLLDWERELLGLYVSDHPLTPYQAVLTRLVTHFSAQLVEANDKDKVRVAGLVTGKRPHQTKNGNAMGFVQLEDIQGTVELLLFPRTWEQYGALVEPGAIILVDGKVDTQSTPPKILVDTIRTEINLTVSREELEAPAAPAPVPAPSARKSARPAPRPSAPPPSRLPDVFVEDWDENSSPPPPDDVFPPGWEEWTPAPGKVEGSALSEVEGPAGKSLGEPAPAALSASAPSGMVAPPEPPPLPEPPAEVHLPSMYAAVAQSEAGEQPPRQITILLRPGDDPERDKRRIRTVHGALISFPGHDRFSFQIFENGRGHLIDFPNYTTRICPEMLARLKKVLGEESWRIEAITYQ